MHITLMEALILGAVQGLTEFLPVSSSAHLVIFQNIFGLKEPIIFFDISLHLGTLLAVVLFLKDDLKAIILEAIKLFIPGNGTTWKQRWNTSPYAWFAFLALFATIPTAVIGILFKKQFEALFSSVPAVGAMLIITAIILYLTKKIKNSRKEMSTMTLLDAIIIGSAQGLAIAPGISRSGTTISFGIYRGIKQDVAARFSFLLSIPAILGAAVMKFDSALSLNAELLPYAAGAVTAGIIGYLTLKLLISMISKGHLFYFAPYCAVVGGLALLSAFF